MSLPYSNKIDIWGLGLIYIEILCDKILFDASSEFEMLDDIFELFGTPTVYFNNNRKKYIQYIMNHFINHIQK